MTDHGSRTAWEKKFSRPHLKRKKGWAWWQTPIISTKARSVTLECLPRATSTKSQTLTEQKGQEGGSRGEHLLSKHKANFKLQ